MKTQSNFFLNTKKYKVKIVNNFVYLVLGIIVILGNINNTNSITTAATKFQAIWHYAAEEGPADTGLVFFTKFFDNQVDLDNFEFITPDDSNYKIQMKRTDLSVDSIDQSEIIENYFNPNILPTINGNHPRYYLVYEHINFDSNGIINFKLWYYNCEEEAMKKYNALSQNIFLSKALYTPTGKKLPNSVPVLKSYYEILEIQIPTGVCASNPLNALKEVELNTFLNKYRLIENTTFEKYDRRQFYNFEVFNAFNNRDLFYTSLKKLNAYFPIQSCSAFSTCTGDVAMIFKVPYTKLGVYSSPITGNYDNYLILYNELANIDDTSELSSLHYGDILDSFFCLENTTFDMIDLNNLNNLNLLILFKAKETCATVS